MYGDSSARIRSVSEVNIKTKLRALVFGEDPRVTNPGDILFEMVAEGNGDRLGANADHFEIYVSGRDIGGLLEKVTRAEYLYRANKEWLSQPVSRDLTAAEIQERLKTNPVREVKHRVPVAVLEPMVAGQVAKTAPSLAGGSDFVARPKKGNFQTRMRENILEKGLRIEFPDESIALDALLSQAILDEKLVNTIDPDLDPIYPAA